jgi:hypothetical protein
MMPLVQEPKLKLLFMLAQKSPGLPSSKSSTSQTQMRLLHSSRTMQVLLAALNCKMGMLRPRPTLMRAELKRRYSR